MKSKTPLFAILSRRRLVLLGAEDAHWVCCRLYFSTLLPPSAAPRIVLGLLCVVEHLVQQSHLNCSLFHCNSVLLWIKVQELQDRIAPQKFSDQPNLQHVRANLRLLRQVLAKQNLLYSTKSMHTQYMYTQYMYTHNTCTHTIHVHTTHVHTIHVHTQYMYTHNTCTHTIHVHTTHVHTIHVHTIHVHTIHVHTIHVHTIHVHTQHRLVQITETHKYTQQTNTHLT